MLGFKRLRLRQPAHKRPVVEISVDNWLGHWFNKRGWAAVTLPLVGFSVILYWLAPGASVLPHKRVHEWVHINQAERPGAFYWQYFRAMWAGKGYGTNALEIEAYIVETLARKVGVPDWAKDQNDSLQ